LCAYGRSQQFFFKSKCCEVIYQQDPPTDDHVFFIVDRNVAWSRNSTLFLSAGEHIKHFSCLKEILNYLYVKEADRGTILCVVGGGSLCDIGAFAASIYLRGLSLMLVPTTLLAMVDAAIGGKTGINFKSGKNIIGSFYPANKVYICMKFLDTLSDQEFKNGLAELIKTAMIGDAILFTILRERIHDILHKDLNILLDIIQRAITVKGKIVEQDLYESEGVREHLNLGHTFAHALESVSDFSYSHGDAVAWGINAALHVGRYLGISDATYACEVQELLSSYGYRLKVPYKPELLVNAMRYDKKRTRDHLRFVLQENAQRTIVQSVDRRCIREVLEYLVL